MNVIKVGKSLVIRSKFLLHKHSPEIWVGAGIVAIIGGTIWACKASRKLDYILEEHELQKEMLDADYADDRREVEEAHSKGTEDAQILAKLEKNHKTDCAKLTIATGVEIAREYAPAVLLIGGGIAMIINGHRILCKRNATILAAYTTLETSFNNYRDRVRKRFGEEVDEELYSGTTYIETTKTITDEDGKKKKVKEKVPVVGTTVSPYARFFDEENTREWMRADDYNRTFLICQQNQANEKLRMDGYLFLNTVYRMLGLSETPTGALCGWILPEHSGEAEDGDPYVQFKIYDGRDLETSEGGLLVDFNCQGSIYDRI